MFSAKNSNLFFTRASLKHIAEKYLDPAESIYMISSTIENPDLVYKGKIDRYIFSKIFHKDERPYPFVVSLEVLQHNVIITAFSSNEKYLKNFEILWRTETLTDDSSIST